MSNRHGSNLINFVKWISKIYVTLERKAIAYPCKIIGVQIKNEAIILEIQFAGLTDKIELAPNEAVKKNYFEYFSPEDKKKIFYYAYNKVSLKLTDTFYCRTKNKEFVKFTDIVNGHNMTLDVTSAAKNHHLLSMMDPIDANKIGFLSGIEYMKTIKSK